MTSTSRQPDLRELTPDDLGEVAGGIAARPGSGPLFPPSTGPTFPTDPEPVVVHV